MLVRKMYALTLILIINLFLAGCQPLSLVSSNVTNGKEEEGYNEELLTMVVPYESGGGTDVFGRFMTKPLSKHIQGNPSIQVENVPGGGSITGTNEYVNSYDKDGTNLVTTSASTHIPYLLDQSSVQYSFDELTPLVGAPTGGVVYGSSDLDIKNGFELGQVKEKLFYAGMSPTGLDLTTLISFEVLEIDAKAVLGYEGRGPARVAFEQGESNIDFQTTTAYKQNIEPKVEDGKAVPLYSLGQIDENGEVVRDPQFPDLPTVKEVYKELHGVEPEGQAWETYKHFLNATYTLQKIIWVHKSAPESAKEELKEAANKLVKDEEFKQESSTILEDYEIYSQDELEKRIEDLEKNTNEETIKWVYDFLLKEHGVDGRKL
ncbi:Bug family tripartite tricarboxylate transporter substrate binding protein [Halobacillus massiliensis]|uniref:Bug family tripartite tricarboxylate transporter substrate binding protein n=1 Tax=Halobacillus massiliensis TaxID=1926286 RepID=UPI001FE5290B|nr:tripartite tricarboxylate transporter substrate-binding protein [Halobacillus massiliensis]